MPIKNIRIISLQPLRQNNLGYIARTMKNFGISNFYIVKPRCKPKGKDAIKFSKHGHDIIEGAKIVNTMEEATKGYFPIGTTAIWHKTERAKFNIMELDKAYRVVQTSNHKKIAIVLGRDDTGLTKEELELFDLSIYIPTPAKYTTLNISHALAIILYIFTKSEFIHIPENISASTTETELLLKQLTLFISSNTSIRKKKDVINTFSRVLKRANPTKAELRTISSIISIKDRKRKRRS